MPGTGRRRILNLLAALPITAIVLGNWENSLWRGLHRKLDPTKASHRYLLRQSQYILEEVSQKKSKTSIINPCKFIVSLVI